ncbi:glycosyltransferase family 2 protein [Robertkochia flava]|uniref:glycosyltransferase family 2 protein n=1 Tax=Robertkochia flava TaxID=3447986 RepID=UPI001CCB6010|nr:glycosyltransferase family 2 protein [Robertkochia marina]
MAVIKVIIPAYNEERSIGKVITDIPDMVNEVIVVNNGSTDQTSLAAEAAGATVLTEERKGYGYACLRGMEHVEFSEEKADIIVFLDGDYSDYPEQLPELTEPILNGSMDMVIGSRVSAHREKGAMTPQQVFGNQLACTLMRWFYDARFTDLGPFRAIRYETLKSLQMEDKTYGWTVEMQLKALKKNVRYTEVPVRYRNRIGVSKVSGTVKGTLMAGYKILGWIFKYSLTK